MDRVLLVVVVIAVLVAVYSIFSRLKFEKMKTEMLFSLYYDGECELRYNKPEDGETHSFIKMTFEVRDRYRILQEFVEKGWATHRVLKNIELYRLTENGKRYIEEYFKIKK